jgi:hypothetical protein
MRMISDQSGPAKAEPPMPSASAALAMASRTMRFLKRVARTSGYCTVATMKALSASSIPHSPYGTPRKSVM